MFYLNYDFLQLNLRDCEDYCCNKIKLLPIYIIDSMFLSSSTLLDKTREFANIGMLVNIRSKKKFSLSCKIKSIY